jgi:serine/threonine protein phosphatase PrpC
MPVTPVLPRSPLTQSSPIPASQAVSGDFICYVCRRRLASAEMLRKHEQMSTLHEKNLKLAKMNSMRRKSDLRQELMRLKFVNDRLPLGSPETLGDKIHSTEHSYADLQEELETRAKSIIAQESQYDLGKYKIAFSGTSWTSNKQTNEDRMIVGFQLLEQSIVGCLVADGHCGDHCAQYLVDNFLPTLETQIQEAKSGEPSPISSLITKGLTHAFRVTDAAYMEYAVANQNPAGSTMVVTLLYIDELDELKSVSAHVGDSRAVLGRSNGTSHVRITEDHKPDRPDEQDRLSRSGGRVVDVGGIWRVFTPNVVSIGGRTLQWGLAVSRAFGDLALKRPTEIVTAEPEISTPITIQPGDFIVVACDGIFDVMSDLDVIKEAPGGSSAIVKAAYGKLSDDNLSAIVVRISEEVVSLPPQTSEEGVWPPQTSSSKRDFSNIEEQADSPTKRKKND